MSLNLDFDEFYKWSREAGKIYLRNRSFVIRNIIYAPSSLMTSLSQRIGGIVIDVRDNRFRW